MAVEERVELDFDDVVAHQVLASRHVRAHLVRLLVEGDEHDVEVPVVVAEVDVGLLRSRSAVDRFALGERVDVSHRRGQVGRAAHVEEFFQLRRARDPRDRDVQRQAGLGPFRVAGSVGSEQRGEQAQADCDGWGAEDQSDLSPRGLEADAGIILGDTAVVLDPAPFLQFFALRPQAGAGGPEGQNPVGYGLLAPFFGR